MCFETLDDLLHERNGILRTSDALARGITKSQFYEYVNSAKLEKAAHGIYVSADMLTDELYLLQARFPRAVFSHEAALYLHDLSEYEPLPLTVTVPASYNSTGLTRKGVKVYYVKPEWYTLGLIEIPSFGGHLLDPLGFCTWVIISVTFEKVYNTPCAQTCAQGDHKDLQSINRACKKCHNVPPLISEILICDMAVSGRKQKKPPHCF